MKVSLVVFLTEMRILRGHLLYLGWICDRMRYRIPVSMYNHRFHHHFIIGMLMAMAFMTLYPTMHVTGQDSSGERGHISPLTQGVSSRVVWDIIRSGISSFFHDMNTTFNGTVPGTVSLQLHWVNKSHAHEDDREANINLIRKPFTLVDSLDLVDRLEKSRYVARHTTVILVITATIVPEVGITISGASFTVWNEGYRYRSWLISHSKTVVYFGYGNYLAIFICFSIALLVLISLVIFLSSHNREIDRFIHITHFFNILILIHLCLMSMRCLDFFSFHTKAFNETEASFQAILGKRVANTSNFTFDSNLRFWSSVVEPAPEIDEDRQLINDTHNRFDDVFTFGVNLKEKFEEGDILHGEWDDEGDHSHFYTHTEETDQLDGESVQDNGTYHHHHKPIPKSREKAGATNNNTEVLRLFSELIALIMDFELTIPPVFIICGCKFLYHFLSSVRRITRRFFIGLFFIYMSIFLFFYLESFSGALNYVQSLENAFGQVSYVLQGVDNPYTWIIGFLLCILIAFFTPNYEKIRNIQLNQKRTGEMVVFGRL